METDLTLRAKLVLSGKINVVTGLSIGGSGGELTIGGVDNSVIRDPLSNEPLIPGSSLKGKMRSLLERAYKGKESDLVTVVRKDNIRIHMCKASSEYAKCPICPLFGLVPEEREFAEPPRLIVRDSRLVDDPTNTLLRDKGDLPYTEIKTEVVLDRITAKANPRDQERVPAGAIFGFEIIFNVLKQEDAARFRYLLECLRLLEDDYLGGQGTRGYGKIRFGDLHLEVRSIKYYETGKLDVQVDKTWANSEIILQEFEAEILPKIKSVFG